MFAIYALYCSGECSISSCKGTDEIRYVGQALDVATRFRKHKEAARANAKQSRRKISWMRGHGVENIRVRVLEETDDHWALSGLEIDWIDALKPRHRLTNRTRGGGAPSTWWECFSLEEQEAHREVMRKVNAARWAKATDAERKAHSAAVSAGFARRPEEAKIAHYSAISTGLSEYYAQLSDDEKFERAQAQSVRMKRYHASLSDEEREELRQLQIASHSTEEARARASVNTAEVMSRPGVRENLSAKSTELWKDKDFARRVNEAQLAAWQDLNLRQQRSASQTEIMKRPEAREAARRGGQNAAHLRWCVQEGRHRPTCAVCQGNP